MQNPIRLTQMIDLYSHPVELLHTPPATHPPNTRDPITELPLHAADNRFYAVRAAEWDAAHNHSFFRVDTRVWCACNACWPGPRYRYPSWSETHCQLCQCAQCVCPLRRVMGWHSDQVTWPFEPEWMWDSPCVPGLSTTRAQRSMF